VSDAQPNPRSPPVFPLWEAWRLLAAGEIDTGQWIAAMLLDT